MKKTKYSLNSDQRGMVSIIVTMVLIIVMSLIVLGMSQNSNREQRQSLDRQLSDQAFYNAESGISDWADYLYREGDSLPPEKTNCETPAADFPASTNPPVPQIDGVDGTNSYTCILYNKAPTSLEFDTVTVSDSIVTPIEPYQLPGGSTLDSLALTWRAKDGNTNTGGCNLAANASSPIPQNLPSNCNVGGLRIDLVNPSGLNRNNIIQNNFPAYLLPGNGGSGTLNYRSNGPVQEQGEIGRANCVSGVCTLVINLRDGSGGELTNGERLYLHFKGLYNTSNLTIKGCSVPAANCGAGNQNVRFNSSQIEIDSTGRATDVLRRVKVRLPVQSQYENAGSFSLKTTQSVCKLIRVVGNEATLDNRCLDN